MVPEMARTRKKMVLNIEKQCTKKMMKWNMNVKGVCPGESRQVDINCCSGVLGMVWP